ncbi:type II secretion system protein GspL [Cupriavidus sp. SW-Y-13]|uniref:type II secretion system protein GspL n=1 Tax=Cupriavidus sp. SW-Y-13 TaxID=2653854 RepID=UPI0013664660|nr:type II secretion system protein GspL [Cupriavidus sp. SW-Y-13]MWL88735.1 general secretion pathway protein GspL [Cupriavidus sp. SW-Y-13]
MSTTLYVRLPHRPHDQPQPWQFGTMPFALVRATAGDKSRRTGLPPAPELLREGHAVPAEMPAADRLVLIVAASDVLLTAAMVPPLPPARLRLALPNLVEDMLATDAAPCHIALGPALDPAASARGARRRLLMVTDRAWLRAALDQFAEHKHRRRSVLPAQLCLPLAEPLELAPEAAAAESSAAEPVLAGGADTAPAPRPAAPAAPVIPATTDESLQPATLVVEAAVSALAQSASLLDTSAPALAAAESARLWQLTVRTGPYDGYGLLLNDQALAAWQVLAPAGHWHGDKTAQAHAPVPALRETRAAPRASRISDAWRIWLVGAEACLREPQLDLAQFEFAQGRMDRWNLRAWRAPVALAVALLIVQIIGMNVQWFMLRQESKRIDAAQIDLLHTAFPNVPPVAEPPLLMRRQIEQLRTASGRSTPSDFLPLADGFARAARDLPPDALLQLDYRAGTLYVTLKPGTNTSALRTAARQVGLQMDEDKNPPDATVRVGGAPTPPGSRWTVKREAATGSVGGKPEGRAGA